MGPRIVSGGGGLRNQGEVADAIARRCRVA